MLRRSDDVVVSSSHKELHGWYVMTFVSAPLWALPNMSKNSEDARAVLSLAFKNNNINKYTTLPNILSFKFIIKLVGSRKSVHFVFYTSRPTVG